MPTVVKATTGRSQGTRSSRRLRREGQLPGVLYGLGEEPTVVQVTYNDLRDALKTDAGLNTIITLDVEGDQADVIVKAIQRDPIKRTVTHADFLRVDEGTLVTVTVPVVLSGHSEDVAEAGAIVEQKMFRLKVLCSPSAIPDQIDADVSNMTIDRRLALGEVTMPPGVSTKVGGNITIAAPVVPRGAKALEEEEAAAAALLEAEGAEGAEGAAPEGDGDGDAGGDE